MQIILFTYEIKYWAKQNNWNILGSLSIPALLWWWWWWWRQEVVNITKCHIEAIYGCLYINRLEETDSTFLFIRWYKRLVKVYFCFYINRWYDISKWSGWWDHFNAIIELVNYFFNLHIWVTLTNFKTKCTEQNTLAHHFTTKYSY